MSNNKSLKQFETYEDAEEWMKEEVDDLCIDNFRFAYQNDSEALYLYEELRDEGCCGFFDEEITVSGKLAQIGCNYGH